MFKNFYFLCTALLLAIFLLPACDNKTNSNKDQADVIVYGGTSAAVAAAVEVARLGKSVILVSPDRHLGGMTSSGLGFTDVGNKSVIGGLAHEFYHRVYLHYRDTASWIWQHPAQYGNKGQGTTAIDNKGATMWVFEPHVAEKIFDDLIRENHIKVFRDEWLNRATGVEQNRHHITSITTLSGKTFKGKMFIDATYEGDLMAAAGVDYTVGRESNSQYKENWNGIETGVFQHQHYFKAKISPYNIPGDSSSGLLPRISSGQPGNKGEGDKRIQAYCYRLCLTDVKENAVPFTRPEGYDSSQYTLLVRLFESGWDELFHKFDPIPNRKTDVNNHGPFSTDDIGMNYDYPEASYEKRKAIIQEHETYQKGLFYFIATDPRVPGQVQAKFNQWGLAKDEFADNDHWPYQLYIREARRMIGSFVMTENEVLSKSPVPQPIGMGSYGLDAHNTERYVTKEGYVQNEGDIGVRAPKPYGIAYGSLIPKKGQCENLLVPVCISASHTAYGSMRMEPVFMILGQSAATAAVSAITHHVSVQEVNYDTLKTMLLRQKQVL